MPRSPLLHGLALTLRHPRPLLWTYAFNAAIAWIASLGLRHQYAGVVANSLAAQRLIGGFDLGVALDASRRIGDAPPGSLTPSFLTTPIYLVLFFLLVPGTLLTYQTGISHRLGTLLQTGVESFWSFLRIALLTLLVAAPTLTLLVAIHSAANTRIDQTITGRPAFLLHLAGAALILLAACLLRLFFDLVEIHTVALGQTLRPDLHPNAPDRRVRHTFRPAWRTLRHRTAGTFLTFVLLAVLGAAAVYLLGLSALHHLAQPRAWPIVLLGQLAIFLLIFTRFWQRAAETVAFRNANPLQARSGIFARPLAANPASPPPLEPSMTTHASTFPTPDPVSNPLSPILPGPTTDPMPNPSPLDPLPGPEPISPSLATSDPGVFHPKDKDLLN